jgi:hypothetical protein
VIPLNSRRLEKQAPPDAEPNAPAASPDAAALEYDDSFAPTPRRSSLLRRTALWQGVYYVVTGAWALLHIRSFIWATGPKTDTWLVKTVGALVCVIGGVLVASARKPEPPEEIAVLGVAAPLALATVETAYVARGRIRPVYTVDAFAQLAIVAVWCIGLSGRAPSRTAPSRTAAHSHATAAIR